MTQQTTVSKPEQDNTPTDEARAFYIFRILQALRQSIRAIDMHSKKLDANYKITGPQLVCLQTISDEQAVSVSTLARLVHLSPSTVVGIVDRLEEKKLVERRRDNKDRRMVSISITNTGQKLVDEAPSPLQDRLAERFEQLGEAEQLQIVQALEQVVDMMGARNLDAAPILDTAACLVTGEDLPKPPKTEDANAEPLDIRPAGEADKANVVRFINSSTEWYSSIVDEKDLSEHAVTPEWAEENFQRREFFIGHDENGEAVGTVSMQFFGDYTYLGYVYIDTNHVGKGYGKQLLDFAAAESKRRGMKGMCLIAHPQATWAVRAYQKYGFRLAEREKEAILAWNDGALQPYYEEYFQLFIYDLSHFDPSVAT